MSKAATPSPVNPKKPDPAQRLREEMQLLRLTMARKENSITTLSLKFTQKQRELELVMKRLRELEQQLAALPRQSR